jgi:predicted RNA-binding Zn ribbon-like protein
VVHSPDRKRSPRLPVKGKKVRQSVRQETDRFAPLQRLAHLLNQTETVRGRVALRMRWDSRLVALKRMVTLTIRSPVRSEEHNEAMRMFNELARDFPGVLKVSAESREQPDGAAHREKPARAVGVWVANVSASVTNEVMGELLWLTWESLFRQKGYERLRECLNCRTWFVDRGRNRQARFCKLSCSNRWWTRGRRRWERERRRM